MKRMRRVRRGRSGPERVRRRESASCESSSEAVRRISAASECGQWRMECIWSSGWAQSGHARACAAAVGSSCPLVLLRPCQHLSRQCLRVVEPNVMGLCPRKRHPLAASVRDVPCQRGGNVEARHLVSRVWRYMCTRRSWTSSSGEQSIGRCSLWCVQCHVAGGRSDWMAVVQSR